jgi:hypothetical protein
MSLYINVNGEIDTNNPIITVHSEFQLIADEKKLEILILLQNWTTDQLEQLNTQQKDAN